MKWFSRRPTPDPTPGPPTLGEAGAVSLQSLGATLLHALPGLENATVDLEFLRARLADLCRDQQAEPADPDEFLRDAQSLDVESQRRLALAVQGLDDELALASFLRTGAGNPAACGAALIAFAREHSLLTASLLMESPLRREEFARHFIVHLGGTVLGEASSVSHERLRRLDYRTLLAEAERAKLSAEERVAYLRRLQAEQEQKIGRRSKF